MREEEEEESLVHGREVFSLPCDQGRLLYYSQDGKLARVFSVLVRAVGGGETVVGLRGKREEGLEETRVV